MVSGIEPESVLREQHKKNCQNLSHHHKRTKPHVYRSTICLSIWYYHFSRILLQCTSRLFWL